MNKVYLVFIHDVKNGLKFGGYFSTKEKAENVCNRWNKLYKNNNQFADFIDVTEEKDDTFILG